MSYSILQRPNSTGHISLSDLIRPVLLILHINGCHVAIITVEMNYYVIMC